MTSYANASSETSQDNNDDNNGEDNTKRNRKTQALSALLSATALGVFLEGCGGEDVPAPTPPAPNLGVLGSASNPFVGTAEANVFVGSVGADWVSYAGSTAAGVLVDLLTPADNLGWADGDTLTDILNIIGSPQGDTLIGNGGENTLRGGLGGDAINGNEGSDTVSYSSSSKGVRVDLSLTGTDAQVDFTTEAGFAENENEAVGDTLSNIENIEGSAHADWLMGDGGNNIIRGGGGGDTINGGGGDDTIDGGVGVDTLDGGDGGDTLSYANEGVAVVVNLDDEGAQTSNLDTISNFENVIGGANNDELTGDGNVNTLDGGAGADTLDGGAGTDTLDGGAGADTYIFRVGDGTDIITDALGDTMTLRFIGDYADTDFAADRTGGPLFAIEGNNLVFTFVKDGITDKVTIEDAYGTGVALRYMINVEYGAAADSLTTITAADGYWSGLEAPMGDGSESNPYEATAGNDVITGSGDANWVSYAGSTAVTIDLMTNPATASRGADGDTLTNIQNIIGTGENDDLQGDEGSNTFRGGVGNDTLRGHGGVDTLYGGAGGDSLLGHGGDDTLYGGAGNDEIDGGEGNDIIYGGAGSDPRLHGGDGDDTIYGGAGDDEAIRGGAGDDTLDGGTGDDTLAGDGGTDTFIFRVGDSSGTNGDIINYDIPGDTMTLRFIGDYVEGDFVAANIKRVDNKLEIILVKDGNTDTVTINNAYNDNSDIGTGNSAFTIEVEYGIEGSDPFTDVTDFWSALGTT